MFGFLRKRHEKKQRPVSKKRKTTRKTTLTPVMNAQPVTQAHQDSFYDIIKKISDLQDQLSRHDSRMHTKLEEHDKFLQSQHHEPMKKAAIEIMNKIYNSPAPLREEVFRIIRSDEQILSIIGDGKMSTVDVAESMGMTREHVSRRISNLTKNGLLARIYEGKRVFYAKPEQA